MARPSLHKRLNSPIQEESLQKETTSKNSISSLKNYIIEISRYQADQYFKPFPVGSY